jgi:hypothetical protein
MSSRRSTRSLSFLFLQRHKNIQQPRRRVGYRCFYLPLGLGRAHVHALYVLVFSEFGYF